MTHTGESFSKCSLDLHSDCGKIARCWNNDILPRSRLQVSDGVATQCASGHSQGSPARDLNPTMALQSDQHRHTVKLLRGTLVFDIRTCCMIVRHMYRSSPLARVDHPRAWIVFLAARCCIRRNDRQICIIVAHNTSHFSLRSNTYTNSRATLSEQY